MISIPHDRGCAHPRRNLALLLWCLAGPVFAQQAPAEVPPQPLPTAAQAAAALADSALRANATLELVAVAALNQRLRTDAQAEPASLVERLASDRDWLDSLQLRFGQGASRSPVLDPAAWHLHRQLREQGLDPGSLVPPLGPDIDALLNQLFTRTDPRQAVAVLPQVLWHLEVHGITAWSDLLAQAQARPGLATALVQRDWSSLRGDPKDGQGVIPRAADWQEWATALAAVIAAEAIATGPPAPGRLASLRFGLLSAMSTIADDERLLAAVLLHFADLVEGLERSRYLHFTEGLLAIVAALDRAQVQGARVQTLAAWLAEQIGALSAAYAQAFNQVDPRLNSAVAGAYDVARNLARAATDDDSNLQQLADAVARLSLMVPDMDFYFDLPVRDLVAGGVDACAGIVAVRDPDGSPAMTRALFDDCQQTLVQLADVEAREAQLAGDPNGPFGESELQRELELTAAQRINYAIGYLQERFATGCTAPVRPLPNPLEWAYLANFMAWFAEQSPVFLQTPENERLIGRMRAIGSDIINVIGEQVDCLAGIGTGVNDPVLRASQDYARALAELERVLRVAESDYRAAVLAPGADIVLDGGAVQATAYRPSEESIGPCDAQAVCEMSGQLSATRALYGLFPNSFLLADQSGMGQVQICYDKVEWVDRRLEPVRENDPNVANYYGHLAFDLRGRYLDGEGATDLFAFRFRSPQEHHYMFAATTPEVLEDACPVEWLGQRIVSTMPGEHAGLVPNRLTYLSAARTQPSRLLARNWDRGAGWRDWFVTGIGVQPLPVPEAPDIGDALEQHLRALYQREQDSIYRDFLGTGTPLGGTPTHRLHQELLRLTTAKSMLRMLAMLFYPQTLNERDEIRAALAGQHGLLAVEVLARLYEENAPVRSIAADSAQRLAQFQQDWQAIPEAVRRTGSVAESVAQAQARLNALHARYFQAPAKLVDEQPASAEAVAQPGQ